MPIYEYRRPDGSTFEVLQSFSDAALKTDPQTGVPVERVLHAPAVHFKGKGFYNTDYGTRKRQRETAADGAKDSASKDASSTDASSSKDSSKDSAPSKDSSESSAAKGAGSASAGDKDARAAKPEKAPAGSASST